MFAHSDETCERIEMYFTSGRCENDFLSFLSSSRVVPTSTFDLDIDNLAIPGYPHYVGSFGGPANLLLV